MNIDFDRLSVLIGPNGSGKSSIVEALELLRKAASSTSIVEEIARTHGGLSSLLRSGERRLSFGVEIITDGGPLFYRFTLEQEAPGRVRVAEEHLVFGPSPGQASPLRVIERGRSKSAVFNQVTRRIERIEVDPDRLLLSAFGVHPPQRAIGQVVDVLSRVEIHVPFDVRAEWVNCERGWSSPLSFSRLVDTTCRSLPPVVNGCSHSSITTAFDIR